VAGVGPVFVGLRPPGPIRHELAARLDAAFADRPVPGRRVEPADWHLSLRYVGEPGEVGLDRLLAALDEADLGRPFDLGLDGLGAFPRPGRANVLWLGVGRGAAELDALRERVEEATEHSGLGREERPFVPHLTLSRIRPAVDVWAWLEADPDLRVRWRVEGVLLMRTVRDGRDSRYEDVADFPLGP
jgi:2'-5' RNA ligase